MRRIVLLLTSLGVIISIVFFVYLINLNTKINNKKNDISKVEEKIKKTNDMIKKKEAERKKIEEENTDKVKVLEVWEEELKREKEKNS